MQAAQVGLVWRTNRRLVHAWSGVDDELFVDIDPWKPEEEDKPKETTLASQPAAPTVKDRILKTSNVVDQADDSELAIAQRSDSRCLAESATSP